MQVKDISSFKDIRNSIVSKATENAEVPQRREVTSDLKKKIPNVGKRFRKIGEISSFKVEDNDSRSPSSLSAKKKKGLKDVSGKNLSSSAKSFSKKTNENASPNNQGISNMDRRGLRTSKPPLFDVHQNPALSDAPTSRSLCPSPTTFIFIISISFASGLALILSPFRENAYANRSGLGFITQVIARICYWVVRTMASIVLLGSLLAFFNAFSEWITSYAEMDSEVSSKKPHKSKISPPSPSKTMLVPLHTSITGSDHLSRFSGGKSCIVRGRNMQSFSTPPSRSSASMWSPVPLQSLQTSPISSRSTATPWSNKRPFLNKGISTEKDLERFLADVDEKFNERASEMRTPPPFVNSFGVASPSTMTSSVNTYGTTRSTPLRPVRMSPGSYNSITLQKKGGVAPMTMEESIESFKRLGIYPHIEHWRDSLRQWFSSVLLHPLVRKIETSHLQVIEAAAKVNISINLSPIGSEIANTPAGIIWKPSFAVDEDGLLHQLLATLFPLLHAAKLPSSNFQQSAQIPVLQEAIDVILEHQRLHALIKGEWGKGLLPHSSVRADYSVQRIHKLAEGTCLKNYEYLGYGEVYDKQNKKLSLGLPSDSHLLIYLFSAFLEYQKGKLHVDRSTYGGAQAVRNPLFLGVLPPKDSSFPEKYIAIISGVPSVLHPGACVLSVEQQFPPIFSLYWDKKHQFSFQGRTALWDAILLLCYKIMGSYDGIVGGMPLHEMRLHEVFDDLT